MSKPLDGKGALSCRLGCKAAGVMVAGLGVMAAFGCSPAATSQENAADSDAQSSAQTTEFVRALEYQDGSDQYQHKSIEVTDEALVGEGAQFVNGVGEDHTYIYKGYAHGDNAHYAMYSLYTELITDEAGKLTAVNLTSGSDTWANKWGYTGARPTIVGTLPQGATLDVSQTTDGGTTVVEATMTAEEGSEAALAGYALSDVFVYNVGEDGTTQGTDTQGRGGTTHNDYDGHLTVSEVVVEDDDDDDEDQSARSERAGGSSEKSSEQAAGNDRGQERSNAQGSQEGASAGAREGKERAATTEAAPENLTVDAEGTTITVKNNAYNLVQLRYRFGTEAYFDQYVVLDDNAAAQGWVEAHEEATTMDAPEVLSGTGVTNRDKWTYSMLSLMAAHEFNSWAATFEDESLYTGSNDGEIGDIDTISGATKTSVPFQSALNQAIEAGYVTGIADSVTVTIDGGDPATGGIDVSAIPQDQTTVTVDENGNYVLYTDFPAGVDEAAAGDTTHAIAVNGIDLYHVEDGTLGTLGVWNLGKGTSGLVPVAHYDDSSKAPGDTTDSYGIYVSDWEYPYNPTLTVTDPSITHVVVNYTIGHETLGIAYDLAAMAQAHEVTELIDALDPNDAAAVAEARAAYDQLSYDVKGTVSNYHKLLAAEAN